ncbi:hypothetical protein BG015_007270 [Linnemannia schmuckeri]|uniref:Uncharacterized protein n=1 Tax=Linnemannia schmuckeri TaxID=64567 RepID=A0A9P5S6E2_9FUNG|nr:hypothetical protein BG015_007270 [Linnemannia schmuckeri]
MDSLSRTPIECLQLILTILQQEGATSTLAALTCTNKRIASVTIPILYNDPYLLSGHFSSFPKILSSAYELHLPEKLTSSSSSQDYLSHVRHLILTRQHQGLFYMEVLDPPELLTYVQSDTELDYMMQVLHPLPAGYLESLITRNVCYRRFHRQNILLRETVWTLADPILEQLQSLTIPLSLIGRYLIVVARLESLKTADFLPDVVYSMTAKDIDEAARVRRAADWRGVVRFVQDHTRLFRGVLKTVTYGNINVWPSVYYYRHCDQEFYMEILKLLPPARITRLTDSTWNQYVAHPLETDLSGIDDIPRLHDGNSWLQGIQNDPLILQKCGFLKTLYLISPGQGSFRWAVREKRRAEGFDISTSNNNLYHHHKGQDTPVQDGFRAFYWQQGLVPLAEVTIREGAMRFTDEVDDIAIGFSRTLTRLEATTAHPDNSPLLSLLPPHQLFFGREWVGLPFLRELVLESFYGPLAIDSKLLSHSPNLVSVWISDRTVNYQYEDIVTWKLQQPAELSKMEHLFLTGLGALTFHPDTLHTTTNLVCLSIQTAPNMIHGRQKWYIPSIEEMDRFYNLQHKTSTRADGDEETRGMLGRLAIGQQSLPRRWSWDWNLPHLSKLDLYGEFAYRFEFRMLQGCPALVHLWLDISTIEDDDTHQRILSSADLFLPPRLDNHIFDSDSSLSAPPPLRKRERIVARSVKYLCLPGQWIMDDVFLQAFLPGMFPNLSDLSGMQYDKNNFTIAGLFRVVKESMPAMTSINVQDYDPSPEEAAVLGLNLVDGEVDDWDCRNPGIDHFEGTVHVQCCFEHYEKAFKLNRS